MPRSRRLLAVEALLAGTMLTGGFFMGYLVGLGSTPSDAYADRDFTFDRPNPIPLLSGWHNGTEVQYYTFGTTSPAAAPMLLFFWEANHSANVEGQKPVIDTVPGHPGYSDFWSIWKVYVPSNYVPDSLQSFEEVFSADLLIEATGWVSNCVIVNENTTLQGAATELREFWYRGAEVYMLHMGMNSPAVNDIVTTAPAYKFRYANGTMVPGQWTVFPTIPGEEGYSDLWQIHWVTVPDDYVAQTYRDEASVLAAEAAGQVEVEASTMLNNCPIVPAPG